MKIKCFSERKLNVRKTQIFTNLQPFNFNLQQDLKIAAFWESPEKCWSKFSKIQHNSAQFWQNLQHFQLVINQQEIQHFLTKKLDC